MTTNVKFGECLSFLLSTLDISMNQLAKAINVDSSLVNRWANGKRIPAYNTVYIESITEYLSKNIKNSFQERYIDEYFIKVCKTKEFHGDIVEKTKKMLLESQGYSIECKKKEKNQKKNKLIDKKQITNPFNEEQIYSNQHDNINFLNQSVSLSDEDKIILGIENIFSAYISLLEIAIEQEYENNKIIYITYNSTSTINDYDKLIHFRNALLNAIDKGWQVILLLKLDNNVNRIIKLIDFIYPVIITGKINISYYNIYNTYVIYREVFLVSDIGLLSCFPTVSDTKIDCGFYLRNKTGIDVFTNYLNMILTNHTLPLIKYQPKYLEYYYDLVESEESIGNRFQYKYCFSMLMLTKNLFEKLLRKKGIPDNEIIIALNIHERRINSFLKNIQNYKYTDIYCIDSIEYLIINKQFHFNYSIGIEIINLELQDIVEILQNIIYLLETYDNFNIAFMPKNIDNFLNNIDIYCTVKERQYVLLKTFSSSEDISEIQLSVEEDMVIKSFYEYFKHTMSQISPINKEKEEVIAMLKAHIDILNN
ncbi:helix-turn-helix transcriptional regulator [Tissierella praeacuta]|uniref:helix-turn-helix domain-containing protein n=1 Tax=Tissierella praeacuta TaxID=43131 RepID=UPI0033402A8C